MFPTPAGAGTEPSGRGDSGEIPLHAAVPGSSEPSGQSQ